MTHDLFDEDGGAAGTGIARPLLIVKKVQVEGWKWITVAIDFSCGHIQGLRHLHRRIVDLTEEEIAASPAVEAMADVAA